MFSGAVGAQGSRCGGGVYNWLSLERVGLRAERMDLGFRVWL